MNFNYGLLAKYLADTISSNEMEEVVNWGNLSAENKKILSDVALLRISYQSMYYKNPERVEEALQKLNGRIKRSNRFRLVRGVLRYAAVFLALFSLSYAGYEYFKPEKQISIVVNPGQEVKKVLLSDGTSVWLKKGSVLKYPESFSSANRRVSLQGEAFFDVAKKTESLFRVSTRYMNIRVQGTTFDVKVDPEKKEVEAILVTGKIDLLDTSWNKIMDVLPGEKVTYNQNKNEYTTEAVDVNIHTSWRLQQFILENATLREIANKLSVKFNVHINIESSTLARQKFRCVINEDESLEDILKLLGYLAPIHYKIERNEVFIYDNKKR